MPGATNPSDDFNPASPASMKIVGTRVMRGPDYWSAKHQQLVVRLKQEDDDSQPDGHGHLRRE